MHINSIQKVSSEYKKCLILTFTHTSTSCNGKGRPAVHKPLLQLLKEDVQSQVLHSGHAGTLEVSAEVAFEFYRDRDTDMKKPGQSL